MKQFKKRQNPINAVQWKPGVKISGVVEMKDIYPNIASPISGYDGAPAEAIWVNLSGDVIGLNDGDWLVYDEKTFGIPTRVKDEFFQRLYEPVTEGPSKASLCLDPEKYPSQSVSTTRLMAEHNVNGKTKCM